eukprot:5085007-Pyramimonas_sp.AAC.1
MESRHAGAGGLPAWEDRVVAWNNRSWNATWMCCRCFVHAWDVRPSVVDGLFDRDTYLIHPCFPTSKPRSAPPVPDEPSLAKELAPSRAYATRPV